MKKDLSLGDLKSKKWKGFIKKSYQIEFKFFDSELPYETRASLFIDFSLLETQN